jgi:hypothetical protein
MTHQPTHQSLWITTLLIFGMSLTAFAQDDLQQRASWVAPDAVAVKKQLDEWLADKPLDELTQLKVDTLWPAEGGVTKSSELLNQVAATIAIVDPEVKKIVDLCRSPRAKFTLPKYPLLTAEETPDFVKHNLRLFYGRWLAQQRMHDEALAQLEGITIEQVVDPASLLFYQSVGYHRLLDKEKCLPAVSKLLENKDNIPRRYSALAELMQTDLKPLKEDSLDEIARLMDDVQRRLELGRAGQRVRTQEKQVVDKLDKIIEELEKQAKQGGGGGGGAASGGGKPSSPQNDSMGGDNRGPGNVDNKPIGNKSGWGNLPEKQRREALQQISKEFPSHFREVIEEYFRRLAQDDSAE